MHRCDKTENMMEARNYILNLPICEFDFDNSGKDINGFIVFKNSSSEIEMSIKKKEYLF
jgi:hypothetical protein